MWGSIDVDLKRLRNWCESDRAETLAEAERKAEEALARGDERSGYYQELAEHARTYRFHWEMERDAWENERAAA
jgi:hypothetical protein